MRYPLYSLYCIYLIYPLYSAAPLAHALFGFAVASGSNATLLSPFRRLQPFMKRQHLRSCLWALVSLGVVSVGARAQERPLLPNAGAPTNTSTQGAKPPFSWSNQVQGAFVSSMARNPRTGEMWFGSEDIGVYRYDPRADPVDQYESGRWSNFRTTEGLGDNNAYALAVDQQGRVWAGTRSHGVSVYNGKEWRTYDVLSGPLGERVFKIAVSPLDGDVWIGTNRGLTRYSQKSDTWRSFTRVDGLPSDQVQALAFTKDGTLFVGTQCDGLAIGKAGNNYATWTRVPGPAHMTHSARGSGLPSSLINDLLVGRDGRVYVATNNGLARSQDNGASWQYLRGRDYANKIKGQYPRLNAPDIQEVTDEDMSDEERHNLLLEDYVTALAEDSQGRIWLGHPRQGVEARTPGGEEFAAGGVVQTPGEWRIYQAQRGRQLPTNWDQDETSDFVSAILTAPSARPLVSSYGSGVVGLQGAFFQDQKTDSALTQAAPAQVASLPSPAAPPSVEELQALTRQVEALKEPLQPVAASYVGEDWITGGDWLGRYGSRYALLCSMQSPLDHTVVNDLGYDVQGRLGWNSTDDDTLRRWLHRERWDDARVLYDPQIGHRRQADWDDHGEAYPWEHEGPDIWVGVRVPAGVHQISLYFFNKDGHDQSNRVRDYLIEVRQGTENLEKADTFPVLARARVRDFWGGVYKTFVVHGKGDYYFTVRRNNTFNAILQAVFCDKLSGPPSIDENDRSAWLGGVTYRAPTPEQLDAIQKAALNAVALQKKASLEAAIQLWTTLGASSEKADFEAFALPGQVMAYRATQAATGGTNEGEALLKAWRWTLPLWSQQERGEFDEAMKRGFEANLRFNPELRNIKH